MSSYDYPSRGANPIYIILGVILIVFWFGALMSMGSVSGVGVFAGAGGSPDFPDPPNCRDFGIEDCYWEYDYSPDGSQASVRLKSGRHTAADVRLEEVNVREFAGQVDAEGMQVLRESGIRRVYSSRIRVAEGIQSNGIGKKVWEAGDALLRWLKPDSAVHVLEDGVGWGDSLWRQVPYANRIYQDGNIYIYYP